MKELIETLKQKVEKHEAKLGAHKETEVILSSEYKYQKDINPEKAELIYGKLVSTLKNIEYHTASAKTYQKVIALIEEKMEII